MIGLVYSPRWTAARYGDLLRNGVQPGCAWNLAAYGKPGCPCLERVETVGFCFRRRYSGHFLHYFFDKAGQIRHSLYQMRISLFGLPKVISNNSQNALRSLSKKIVSAIHAVILALLFARFVGYRYITEEKAGNR